MLVSGAKFSASQWARRGAERAPPPSVAERASRREAPAAPEAPRRGTAATATRTSLAGAPRGWPGSRLPGVV